MSVINQMLKDLDKRNTAATTGQTMPYQAPVKRSPLLAMLVVAVIALLVGAGAIYWLFVAKQPASSAIVAAKLLQASGNAQQTESGSPQPSSKVTTRVLAKAPSEIVDAKPPVTHTDNPITDQQLESNSSAQSTVDQQQSDLNVRAVIDDSSEQLIENSPEQVRAAIEPIDAVGASSTNQSSLSISTVTMTPAQLAAKKIKQAEKALSDEQGQQAELYYEEALMLQPSHVDARQQLAALWFGRQAHQNAVNLLKQGVALLPDNRPFRIMLARLYLYLNQAGNAYKILAELHAADDMEYQLILANAAQQSGEFQVATAAYRQMLQNQPDQGRWWLGLAVAHDSAGEFIQAKDAYQQAILSNALTANSLQFAKQRLVELGE